LFATALADDPEIDAMSMRSQGLDWPRYIELKLTTFQQSFISEYFRVVVWISPKQAPGTNSDIESAEECESLDTMNFMNMPKRKPSPFSSRRVVHESGSGAEDEHNNRKCLDFFYTSFPLKKFLYRSN
jgi:hypothetical protein